MNQKKNEKCKVISDIICDDILEEKNIGTLFPTVTARHTGKTSLHNIGLNSCTGLGEDIHVAW